VSIEDPTPGFVDVCDPDGLSGREVFMEASHKECRKLPVQLAAFLLVPALVHDSLMRRRASIGSPNSNAAGAWRCRAFA